MISEKVAMQKAVADECLSMIELIDPTAIVAGGAPRDWYFGKEASDIDIFFYSRPDISKTAISLHLERIGFKDLKIVQFTGDESFHMDSWYARNHLLRQVWDTVFDGVNVQLVLMKSPTRESVVPKFPLNICRIWYKDGKINLTPDFERAVNWKSIVKCDELYADSRKYLQKIKSKFPDFRFYNSYEDLAKEVLDGKIKKEKE